MKCGECRAELYARAEEGVQSDGTGSKWTALSVEAKRHIEECSACASRAKALKLISTEGALHADVPDEAFAERMSDRVMGRVHEREALRDERRFADDRDRFAGGRRSLRRAAYPAAAAVLLVVVSVSLTLFFSERRFPQGNALTEEKTSGNREEVAVETPKEEAQRQEMDEEVVTVRLTLEAPGAEQVAVVGDWNGWDADRHLMHDRDRDGVWELRLKLKEGGEYQYQFLINGKKWIPDPKAPLKVEDGFGGTNSILDI